LRLTKLTIVASLFTFTTLAFAQQSEFREKLQEDLDSYKKQIVSNCGASEKLEIKWTGGKLDGNPRESTKPEWNAVSTLCTSGLEAISNACQGNKVVKSKLAKLTTIGCKIGKGTIDYKLASATLTLTIDPSYTKDNAAGQRDAVEAKIKKQLDD
jgi:hypothetical protein